MIARNGLRQDGCSSDDAFRKRVLLLAAERDFPPTEYAKLMRKRCPMPPIVAFRMLQVYPFTQPVGDLLPLGIRSLAAPRVGRFVEQRFADTSPLGPGGGRGRAGYCIDFSQSPGVVIQIFGAEREQPQSAGALIDVTPNEE